MSTARVLGRSGLRPPHGVVSSRPLATHNLSSARTPVKSLPAMVTAPRRAMASTMSDHAAKALRLRHRREERPAFGDNVAEFDAVHPEEDDPDLQ